MCGEAVALTDRRLRKQLAGEEAEVSGGRPKEPEAGGDEDKGRRLVGLESSAAGTYAECYPGYVCTYVCMCVILNT